MAIIELPASLVVADHDFELECKVEAHFVGVGHERITSIEKVTLGGENITSALSQSQLEGLADTVGSLYQ